MKRSREVMESIASSSVSNNTNNQTASTADNQAAAQSTPPSTPPRHRNPRMMDEAGFRTPQHQLINNDIGLREPPRLSRRRHDGDEHHGIGHNAGDEQYVAPLFTNLNRRLAAADHNRVLVFSDITEAPNLYYDPESSDESSSEDEARMNVNRLRYRGAAANATENNNFQFNHRNNRNRRRRGPR